jgi:hypothetical protein
LKADVNVPKGSNKQKTIEKKTIFVDTLKATEEKSRIEIRIRNSQIRIRI